MDVRNGAAEPPEGFSSAPPGATSSPEEAAACSQLAGGPGVVRLCDDCGRDTYSLTSARCAPCRRDEVGGCSCGAYFFTYEGIDEHEQCCRLAQHEEMSGDELWPLLELDGGEG